jgi:hypothetical protein
MILPARQTNDPQKSLNFRQLRPPSTAPASDQRYPNAHMHTRTLERERERERESKREIQYAC